jgi:protein gp37
MERRKLNTFQRYLKLAPLLNGNQLFSHGEIKWLRLGGESIPQSRSEINPSFVG